MILHVFVSDVWQLEGSHSKIVCKPEVTRPETNRSYEWAIPRHPRRKFIFQPLILRGEMLVSKRVLGCPWYLVHGFITLYKLVVSPISRLYTNLLTSYDHFHGSTLVVMFHHWNLGFLFKAGVAAKRHKVGSIVGMVESD